MKIRIKEIVPEALFTQEIAEHLVGCEVSLQTMSNPDGDDDSELDSAIAGIFGQSRDEIQHEVYVGSILEGVRAKHGDKTHDDVAAKMSSQYGAGFLISNVGIPVGMCEVVPD